MRSTPPNDITTEIHEDSKQFGMLIGMDLKFPYTTERVCKNLGMKDVQVVVTDSLESPEMVAKTREIACQWYLEGVLPVLVPLYMPLLKGLTKDEALVKRDELVQSVKGVYASGVTPGLTMVRIVARKAGI
jgi:hypothetical protein